MYSKEEVAEFKAKDLRISKLAITKSLIEKLPLEDIYEVEKVNELAEKYVDYVYEERRDSSKRGDAGCVTSETEAAIDWVCIAEGLNFAKPNTENIKILNGVLDEYKQVNKANANPSDVLTHIFSRFGKYPEKQSSIRIILESLKRT